MKRRKMEKLKFFQTIKNLKNFLFYLEKIDFNFSKLSEKELKKLLEKSEESLELLNKLRNFVLLNFLIIFLSVFSLIFFKVNNFFTYLLVILIYVSIILIFFLKDVPNFITLVQYNIYGLKRELNKRKRKKYIWGGLK